MIGYYIKTFEMDIGDIEILHNREFYYSEKELLDSLQYILEDIYTDYCDKNNILNYSYDNFYTDHKPFIKISVISLNHRNMTTKIEYENYLREVKQIKKEDLMDYLLSFTDECILYYDHNLNLLDTLSHLTNCKNVISYDFTRQFAFSYKALFPDKYHVDKYKIGDKVLYEGIKCTIHSIFKNDKSIFESDNPLNYLYGYRLIDDYGYIPNDDRFSYFVVDEDLESLNNNT